MHTTEGQHTSCYDPHMSDDDLLARLEEKAVFHKREAERYAIAADVLRGELRGSRGGRSGNAEARAARTPVDPRTNTTAMLEQVLNDASGPMHATELVAEMQKRGWETSSPNPVNLVRTAAHRLADRERARRHPDGRFGPTGQPEQASFAAPLTDTSLVTATLAEPSSDTSRQVVTVDDQ